MLRTISRCRGRNVKCRVFDARGLPPRAEIRQTTNADSVSGHFEPPVWLIKIEYRSLWHFEVVNGTKQREKPPKITYSFYNYF